MEKIIAMKKLTSREVSILEYCTADVNGRIVNQDTKIQQCFNENLLVNLDKCTLVVNTLIRVKEGSIVINGTIEKGQNPGQIVVTGTSKIENVHFKQTNFNIRQSLLLIESAVDVKIENCEFANSTLDVDSESSHKTVRVFGCKFTSDNTAPSTNLDFVGQNRHHIPQNVSIRALMMDEETNIIENLIVRNCTAYIGRCFLSCSKTYHLDVTGCVVIGNGVVTETNNLDWMHLKSLNSFKIESNTFREYKNTWDNSIITVVSSNLGTISNNIVKSNRSGSGIYVDACNCVNVIGNVLSSVTNFELYKGIEGYGGQSYIINSNQVSNCRRHGICLGKQNMHSNVCNNMLKNNNQEGIDYAPGLFINSCHRFNAAGNMVIVPGNQETVTTKPALTCTDNIKGTLSLNYCTGTADIARNDGTLQHQNTFSI